MISPEQAASIALSFPETTEQPHFEKRSFRVGKKIFATLQMQKQRFVLKLSVVDQSVFCDFQKQTFFPVDGAWGKQGWTIVDLQKVREDMFRDAIQCAWNGIVPQKLRKQS